MFTNLMYYISINIFAYILSDLAICCEIQENTNVLNFSRPQSRTMFYFEPLDVFNNAYKSMQEPIFS